VTATWWRTDSRQSFVATRRAGESEFGAPIALGPPGSVSPQLVVNEAGGALVAWAQEGGTRCDFPGVCATELWLRVRPPGGRELGPPVLLEEQSLNAASLALNESGDAVVSWTTYDGAVEVAEGSLRSGIGPARELWPVRQDEGAWQSRAAIGENGAALVAWNLLARSGPRPLFASYRPAGGDFGPPEDASAESFGAGPAVMVDPRGTATVAFQTGFGEAAMALRPPHGAFSAPAPVVPAGAVELRQDAAGNQLAYWSTFEVAINSDPDPQPYASVRRPGGEWSAPYPILPRRSYPEIDLDGRGNAVALYTTPPGAGQQLRAATLTRFDLVERPQALNAVTTSVQGLAVNAAGSSVALVSEYRDTDSPTGGPVTLITQRPADETAARVSLRASVRASRLRLTARCDEICRLRPRLGPAGGTARAARRGRTLTLQARRRGRLSVRLGKAMRARLRRGRPIRLRVRAVDAYGNVRVVRRRVGRSTLAAGRWRG
jgi:hypothetical protein